SIYIATIPLQTTGTSASAGQANADATFIMRYE
ncbi:hypothetical protein ACUOCP_52845, partial [Escherichia sp. R-CC3]